MTLTRCHTNLVEQSLFVTKFKGGEENWISSIAKHIGYCSFLSGTHQGIMAEQSLIGTELEDGEENLKHSET